ncbi:MAG: DNA polymerase III subunit gamma/tau [Oscillospiraceae bacterium]
MYEALYRKYRPKTFDDVVGQPFITETLKTQVRTGRLSHAYLFIGTRGTGKTTCARILAKAVNCEHPVDGNPCNECDACRGIEDGSVLDVVELDAASNNGVDDVRMLRDEAIFSPTTVRKRVYIIDEVHMLSKPAFNALLKILEEPPQHLMFILATTELNKVLPTILSRCQRHSFRRLDGDTIAKRLAYVAEQEGINLTADAAQLLGRLADGGMRDGLSLLDQCSAVETVDAAAVLNAMGLAGTLRTQSIAEAVLAGNTEEALTQFESLWQDGKDPAALLGELSGLFRDALLLRLAPKGGRTLISGAYGENVLRDIRAGDGNLLWLLNTLQKHQALLRETGNPRLQTELCLAELSGGGEIAPPCTAAPASGAAPASPKPQGTYAPPPAPPADEATPAEKNAPVYAPPAPASVPVPAEDAQPAPPSVEPAPAGAAADEASAGGVSWEYALSQLENELPIGVRIVLTDAAQSSGEIRGGELILRLLPGFAKNTVNVPDVLNKIRQKVSALCGAPMQIRLEELQSGGAQGLDKLDFLGKFGNVTIQ